MSAPPPPSAPEGRDSAPGTTNNLSIPALVTSAGNTPQNRSRRTSGEGRVRFSLDTERPSFRPRQATRPNTGPNDEPTPPQAKSARSRVTSLRQSLRSGNNGETDSDESTIIEMIPSSSSGSSPDSSTVGKKSSKHARVTVSDEIEIADDYPRKPAKRSSDSKRLSDTLSSLPLYQKWLETQKHPPEIVQKANAYLNKARDFFSRINVLAPSPDGRHVRITTRKSVERIDERTNKQHIDNTIRSTRYTALNFLPKQLWAQFGKVANMYFLAVATMQMIPNLSTTGTYTTIVPLLIFVSISMGKEGFDDFRRKRLDKEENERIALVLDEQILAPAPSPMEKRNSIAPTLSHSASFGWREEKWQDVRVGDVLLLTRDSLIPADVILLHADDPTNTAFIETKSLDGETNLKSKRPVNEFTKYCQSIDTIGALNAEFVVEDPNLDLYKFDGKVIWRNEAFPVTNTEVVLRGSILRNTRTAIGLVIYSGEECKIRMNANKNPRVKAPTMQAIVNKVVILIACLVIFMALILSVAYQVWHQREEVRAWYFFKAQVPFGHILASFVIMYNTMLPLSLYVSMEIVKLAQMFMMNDIDMYDQETDIPMEARTSTINEELGQVSYIFSDKTGTLTNNSMRFRKMSIAGTAWLHDKDIQDELAKEAGQQGLRHKKGGTRGRTNPLDAKTPQAGPRDGRPSEAGRPSMNPEWQPPARDTGSLHTGKTEQLMEYVRRKPQTIFSRKVRSFIVALALCHTCIPETDDDGNITFQAASPDELALVMAAQDLGWEVIDRTPTTITLKFLENGRPVTERFELLDVIEFTSARKRMSAIIRLPDGRICLFTKGADTIIKSLLRLTQLANATSSAVHRRASMRKSMEAQEVIRRKSVIAGDWQRTSVSYPAGTTMLGRKASIAGGYGADRQSIDVWLKERENEVEVITPRKSNQFYAPRPSISWTDTPTPHSFPGRLSSTFSDEPSTTVDTSSDELDEDDPVDESIVVNDAAVFERCFQHIDDFATEGLRTLLYAHRFLTEEEYTRWKDLYAAASTSLVDRQHKLEQVGEMIETKLELLGATAIEDKLQKGVPDAIDRLRRAGIKLWMLTGDKRETAINIGHSCRLIKDYSTIIILDHENGDLQTRLTTAVAEVQSAGTAHSVLVIDGATLAIIDAEAASKALFTDVAILADAVICCRASPSQKASLVRTIRLKVKGSVTLAIGDGANDIAMIQEAHLGIGIAGKEGLQASRSSDYSIAQFRFLLKLLLVHGRWNYVRICKYTLGTFWKEMLFYLVQAMYQRYNGYTGTSLYEPWSMSMFNTLFTSLPVIFMGIFEKDLAPATLLAVPELYNYGQRNRGFNFPVYLYWASLGAVESVIIYFSMFGLFGTVKFTKDNFLFPMGCLCFSACVVFISIKLLFLEMHDKSIAVAIGAFLSVGGWWAWNLALSSFYPNDPIYWVKQGFLTRFGRNPLWWLTLVLSVLSIALLEIVIKTFKAYIKPSDVDTFQQLERDDEIRKRFEESAADLMQLGWQGSDKKGSMDLEADQAEREAHIEELLSRPRSMETSPPHNGTPPKLRRRHSGSTEDGQVAFKLGRSAEGVSPSRRADHDPRVVSPHFGATKLDSDMRR